MELLHKNITEKIIKSFYKVYNELGYGFLEKVYENAMLIELKELGLFCEKQRKIVTTQPLNMEFLPQIAQIYADLKPPKVVYWRKLIKKDFILICDVCVICGKYLFMNSLNRLSSYEKLKFIIIQK